MPRITTKRASDYLENEMPFTTNGALSAMRVDGNYVVLSYGTAIGVINHHKLRTYINTARYSATTSRHQAITEKVLKRLAALDGYEVEEENNPEIFTDETGYRARVFGANKRREH